MHHNLYEDSGKIDQTLDIKFTPLIRIVQMEIKVELIYNSKIRFKSVFYDNHYIGVLIE